jgi:hypothetical protein
VVVRPYGHADSIVAMSSVAAPLLAGFSITCVTLAVQWYERFRCLGLRLLSVASVVLLMAVQYGFWARRAQRSRSLGVVIFLAGLGLVVGDGMALVPPGPGPGVAAWTASRLRSCHRLRAAVGECVVDDRRPKGRRQPLGHPEDVVRDVGACCVICPEEESNESYRAQMARTRCRPNGLPRAVRRPAGRSRCWGAVIGPTGGASAS